MKRIKECYPGSIKTIIHILIVLCLCTSGFYANGQTTNPFLSLKFDKIILYDYEQDGENPSFIGDNGQVIKGVKINRQATLDSATAKIFNTKIGDYKSYGKASASCFEPHLAILYYLKGKVATYISLYGL